jgi:AcrR family transcriptional regulator
MSEPRVPVARGPERAQAQRERILAAAKKCFVEHGFHAASMGVIAHEAGMSPGLIYRYYDSKSTIIVAIMARQLEESRESIRKLNSAGDFAEAIFATYSHWRDRDSTVMSAALFAEMSAEATRDPAVAAALRTTDQAIRDELCQVISTGVAKSSGKEIAPDLAARRALALQCFIEGLAIRAMREPELDPEVMKVVISGFFDALYDMAK